MINLDDFMVIPIAPGTKSPMAGTVLHQPVSYYQLANHVNQYGFVNVALRHLESGTVCIDVDDIARFEVWWNERFGLILPFTKLVELGVCYASGKPNRMKILFRAVPLNGNDISVALGVVTINIGGNHVAELRTGNSYDLLPGCLHPDGMIYSWLSGEPEQLRPLPKVLLDAWYEQISRKGTSSGNGTYGVIKWFDELVSNGIGILQYAIELGYIDMTKPHRRGRYCYFDSTSNDPGIMVHFDDTRMVSFHQSDPLHGKPISPSDIFRELRCGGDYTKMVHSLHEYQRSLLSKEEYWQPPKR